MTFYPNKKAGKGYLIILLILCILFFIIWLITKIIFFITSAIILFLISLIWFSPFFLSNKSLEIKDKKVILVFSKKSIEFDASNLYKIFIRKNGIKSYYFAKEKFAQRITPKGYLKWEALQREFDRLFKPMEKTVQVIKEKKTRNELIL